MEFKHLPLAGGLYDQHPKFLDDFLLISGIDNRIEEEKSKKRERENRAKAATRRGRK